MNAHVPIPVNVVAVEARFADLCDNRALLYIEGVLTLHEAVDECHGYAALSGLIDRVGQDSVQHLMAMAFAATDLFPNIEQVDFEVGDIVRRWELADSRDRWRHTGEAPPKNCSSSELFFRSQPYSTPQATVDAFWYVVRLDDRDQLARWLANHPTDAPYLFKIWKAKRCS
jgi:hypothetical protein